VRRGDAVGTGLCIEHPHEADRNQARDIAAQTRVGVVAFDHGRKRVRAGDAQPAVPARKLCVDRHAHRVLLRRRERNDAQRLGLRLGRRAAQDQQCANGRNRHGEWSPARRDNA